MIRIPTHRAPTHPGGMLLEEFVKPMGLTQRELAEAINVPYKTRGETTPLDTGSLTGWAVNGKWRRVQ